MESVSLLFPTKKTVRFKENVEQVFEILHRSDLTQQEYEAANFTEGEYLQIRAREKTLARRLAASGTVFDLGEADLGLETREGKFYRRQRVHECCMSVLLEQELLRETTGCNPEGLAEVYAEYSVYASKLAHDRAYQNTLQVEQVSWMELAETIASSYVFIDTCGNVSNNDMEPIPYSYSCYAPCTATAIEEDELPLRKNCPSKYISAFDQAPSGMPRHAQTNRDPTQTVAHPAFHLHYHSSLAQPWDVWAHHMSDIDGTRV